MDKVEGENGRSGGQSLGWKSYRIFFFPEKIWNQVTHTEKYLGMGGGVLRGGHLWRETYIFIYWQTYHQSTVLSCLPPAPPPPFEVMIFLVNKTWHITHRLIFTYIEKENYFLFLLCQDIFLYIVIYNWTITGMHIIRTGLKWFYLTEESVVTLLSNSASSTNIFYFYFLYEIKWSNIENYYMLVSIFSAFYLFIVFSPHRKLFWDSYWYSYDFTCDHTKVQRS